MFAGFYSDPSRYEPRTEIRYRISRLNTCSISLYVEFLGLEQN
jgi:hypothetical protein